MYKLFDFAQNEEKSGEEPYSSAVELKPEEKPVILLNEKITHWEGALWATEKRKKTGCLG
ncbi:hypothetical protein KQI82_11580 [Oscillibacter sp. MSJ-2]|uniref:Uncharacterized protein n=1 Tax=Dysosmobacter acutus TaxID=2841504 RepID=A0ABS6FD37_9FIRM|nr:hypothetical protein [Dysosmobacter acutus]MBU5627551.1 hypothetical protein [Dysosmobacter acutus]